MRHLDLFSGIGGFALAAQEVGWQTVAFCEIEPFAQKVLRKHWPDVPIFDDVKTLTGDKIKGPIDIITGGFPCQDISFAGKGAGIEGERSGLWSELCRIIGEVRPRYAVMENVAALLHRGLERVLGDLATIGYDAEWHCIPASYVGAPHRRDRIWIIAYPKSELRREARRLRERSTERAAGGTEVLTNANSPRLEGSLRESIRRLQQADKFSAFRAWNQLPEPTVRRGDDGFSTRVDRLRGLGNAIVPQVAETIFRSIAATAPRGHEQ